ncbi:MAG: RHS repeat-associated core domain-containing protein [Solirubrobacteraceae bacterium]
MSVAGELKISHSIESSTASTVLTGPGTTTLEPEATGALAGRMRTGTLINDGEVRAYGLALEAAHITNKGTFIPQSEGTGTAAVSGDTSSSFTNTGRLRKISGLGLATAAIALTNSGVVECLTGELQLSDGGSSEPRSSWSAATGAVINFTGSDPFSLKESQWAGEIEISGTTTVTTEALAAEYASVNLADGRWKLPSGTTTVAVYEQGGAATALEGAGTLKVTGNVHLANEGKEYGPGTTTITASAEGSIAGTFEGRTLVNEGHVSIAEAYLTLGAKTTLENTGTLIDNYEVAGGIGMSPTKEEETERVPRIINSGIFEHTKEGTKEEGSTSVSVWPYFFNEGIIKTRSGVSTQINFRHLINDAKADRGCETSNPVFPKRETAQYEGVCVGSGDLTETQTDFAIGGRGLGLNITRTYNSQAALAEAKGGKPASTLGYGWSSPYSTHLAFGAQAEENEAEREATTTKAVTLIQESGSQAEFHEGEHGSWIAPSGSPAALSGTEATGYTLTLEDQQVDKFSGTTGRLESMTDRFGNKTSLIYNGAGQLAKVEDPSGRDLTFSYNSEGLLQSVEDPMKHVVKYEYSSGALKSVTQLGEEARRWQFTYEANAQLHEMVDGRGRTTTWNYVEGRVAKKIDPMGRETTFAYGPDFSEITNLATAAVTIDYTNTAAELMQAVNGFGTEYATTQSFTYDKAGNKSSATEGDGHTTKYEYSDGNLTLEEDPEGHKHEWTYDSTHDIKTETTPDGETTTYEREADGNPTSIKRPAPHGETQVTEYKYDLYGLPELMTESITGSVKRTTKYEYDEYGDKKAETDEAGDKRTWSYNPDSQETTMISPRGYETGKESKYTTTTKRTPQGLPEEIETPMKHVTKYKYDGDQNLVEQTDPLGNVTKYKYDNDDELEETELPNKAITKTEYDGAGQVIKQTDGDGHATKYRRNVLEEVEETVAPFRERKTRYAYDHDGHRLSLENAEKATTIDKYDADGRLTEVSYSDGKTPAVNYEYNGDGLRTNMTDGTGSTAYEYDELDRLDKTTDGHGDTVTYEYDLANEPTKITYPNGKAVERKYDKAGRLETVTDWEGRTTTFGYDADSENKTITFPSGTGDTDIYTYDETDSMSEAKFAKGETVLASVEYTRNKDSQVTKAKDKSLPGEESPSYSYDENRRLTKGAGLTYKYDNANNPTTIAGSTATYDAADELEKAGTTSYTYNELGERTKRSPAIEANTTYGYNQAEDLTSATKTGSFEDTYEYNGDGLRTAEIKSGAPTYVTWDLAEPLPLILNDGTYSYIYGPGGLPIEQIAAGGAVTYLHHDEQGSTRLITGTTGAKEASTTYDAYGNALGSTGSVTSRLGYDGQYSDADTGLVYLRARYYDPGTAQFLSRDPVVTSSDAVYEYANDEPLGHSDRTGERPQDYNDPHSCIVESQLARSRYYTRGAGQATFLRLVAQCNDEKGDQYQSETAGAGTGYGGGAESIRISQERYGHGG